MAFPVHGWRDDPVDMAPIRGVVGVALVFAMAATASAQRLAALSTAPSDEWRITIEPYVVVASTSGTAGVNGYGATIDSSASDLIDHLAGGFMGFVDVTSGKWGIAADAFYARLGNLETKGPATIAPTSSSGLYTFLGSRRFSPVAELVFGARVSSVTTTVAFTASGQREISHAQTWIDPVVGMNIVAPAGARTKFSVLAELGGFGTASTISVDLLPALQLRLARHAWLAVGYRYIYDDYSDDAGFDYKATIRGPAFGVRIPLMSER